MASAAFELPGHPRNALLLAARLLLAFIFIHEGVFLLANFDSAASAMSKMGVPSPALVATIALQLFAGCDRAWDVHTVRRSRACALLLATAFLFHQHFAVRDELLHFEKDLAIAGGLLVLAVQGGGDWSIEALSARALLWAPRQS